MPAFHSILERTLAEELTSSRRADVVLSLLEAWLLEERFTKEELEFSRLREWLVARGQGPVAPEEVRGQVLNHGVRVLEMLKESDPGTVAQAETRMDLARHEYGEDQESWPADVRARIREQFQSARPASDTTRRGFHQLPGGAGYRELLLVLDDSRYDFRTPGFDERNILAVARFNERTDLAGRKALFLEELSSWWAYKIARDGAWGDQPNDRLPAGWTVEKRSGTNLWAVVDRLGRETRFRAPTRAAAVASALPDVGAPMGPFVGRARAWVALALKRLAVYAAENGFDLLAWPKGEALAYYGPRDVRVSRLEWAAGSAPGLYHVGLVPEGEPSAPEHLIWTDVTELDLIRRYGGDIASSILDSERSGAMHGVLEPGNSRLFNGADPRGLYDRTLPEVAGGLFHRFGARSGMTEFDCGCLEGSQAFAKLESSNLTWEQWDSLPQEERSRLWPKIGHFEAHCLAVSPAMRQEALERGFPLFAKGEPGAGSAAADVRFQVDAVFRNLLTPAVFERIRVVQSETDLPWTVYAHLSSGTAPTQGLYVPAFGEIYLVADNIDGREDALRCAVRLAVRHEMTHMGLDAYTDFLADRFGGDVARASERVRETLERIYEARSEEIEELAAPGRPYHGVYDGMEAGARRRRLAEEWIASRRGRFGEPGLLADLVAGVKDVFRAVGVRFRFTDSEIALFEKQIDRALLVWRPEESKIVESEEIEEAGLTPAM